MEIRHNISEDCQTRIITDYGSNERCGLFLKVKYQMQEDGSDVGAPAEYYTGSPFLISVLNYGGFFTIHRDYVNRFFTYYNLSSIAITDLVT